MGLRVIDIKRSTYRGHAIKIDISLVTDENMTLLEYNKIHGVPQWIYCDTLKPIDWDRPCVRCGAVIAKGTPDPCYGQMEGVTGACCGHGDVKKQYINFANGDGLSGEECEVYMTNLQKSPE